jgi:hypothetical protein
MTPTNAGGHVRWKIFPRKIVAALRTPVGSPIQVRQPSSVLLQYDEEPHLIFWTLAHFLGMCHSVRISNYGLTCSREPTRDAAMAAFAKSWRREWFFAVLIRPQSAAASGMPIAMWPCGRLGVVSAHRGGSRPAWR